MAGSIRDPGWWQPYLPQLRREFSELTMDILIAGGDAGAGSILAGSALVDWDVFNEDALTWLDMYLGGGAVPGLTQEGAYAWAWSLNESTRRGVVREIDRWVRNGDPLPELEKRLRNYFDDRRAHRVAVTEVTRIFASGNVMAWKASGVVSGKRWRTAVDERACPICSKLNGSFVELDRGWEFSRAMLDADPALARALRAPLTVVVPPAHVACLLPGTVVSVPGQIRYATKSFYDGRVIEIRTQSGRVLTVTENHPILTGRGWIAAEFLTEADHVFSSGDAERIAAVVSPNNEHVPTAVEEIFRALKESPGMIAGHVPVTAEDFHGDGRSMDGYIEIIAADGLLNGDMVSSIGDPASELSFFGRGFTGSFLTAQGGTDRFFEGDDASPRGAMSWSYLSHPRFCVHALPFDSFGFGLTSRDNPVTHEVTTEGKTADTQLFGEGVFGFTGQIASNPRREFINDHGLMAAPVLIDTGGLQVSSDSLGADIELARQFTDRFASQITADQVVKIINYDFRGHVFNLQADPYRLYFANGIISHNCRCWLQPVVLEAMTPEEIDAIRWTP